MLLDHIFMCVVMGFVSGPFLVISILRMSDNPSADINPFSDGFLYLFEIGFALYFCKDCIAGRSLAKRILKLQILNHNTGNVASPVRCVIRNLFCVLWPVEVIFALINPARRIGDFVAGTTVAYFDAATIVQSKLNVVQIVVSFLIAYAFLMLVNLGLESLIHFY